MKPRAAMMRQQQSQNRRTKIEESVAQAQREDIFWKHNAMRDARMPQSRFAFTNRVERKRDRNRGVITQAEWDELVEKHEDSGKTFRYCFGLLILASVLLLSFAKYDEEYNLEVPQIESGVGFGEILDPEEARHLKNGAIPASELEKYYATLGVTNRMKKAPEDIQDTNVDADKERRRENYRVRQEIKRAYEQHHKQAGQLVHCGRSCEAKNQQVELAYRKLSSQVDRELFGVLLDASDTKSVRSTTPEQLRKAYLEKKELIERTEEDEEDRQMALEELKDAYDIIIDADARKYYLLYGAKPPETMRHISARHGGWGQEMALGTFKYRLIIAWLDYLHQYIGLWGETAVLACVLIFVLARIPGALQQSQRLLDDLEWAEQDAEKAQTTTSEATDS